MSKESVGEDQKKNYKKTGLTKKSVIFFRSNLDGVQKNVFAENWSNLNEVFIFIFIFF